MDADSLAFRADATISFPSFSLAARIIKFE